MAKTVGELDFKTAIQAAISTFENAANTKDAATIANLYGEDATLLPPGSPALKGRQNIQQYWQAFFDAGASDAQIRSVEVNTLGDTAYEIGEYEATLPVPQGGTARSQGKYVVIWKRQPDGS